MSFLSSTLHYCSNVVFILAVVSVCMTLCLPIAVCSSACLTVNVQLDMPLGIFASPLVGQYPPIPDFLAGISTINSLTAQFQLPVFGVGQIFDQTVYWQNQCFVVNLLPNYRLVGSDTQIHSIQDLAVLADELCRNDANTHPQVITALDATTKSSEMFRALNYVCNSFNIPTIGLFYTDAIFSDKTLYPLSSRVEAASNEEAITVFQILQRYGWKRLAVLQGLTYSEADTVTALQQLAVQTNTQLFVQTISASADCSNAINQIVAGAWKIVYVLGLPVDIQQCVSEMLIHRQLGSLNYITILSGLSMATLTTGADLSTLPSTMNANASLFKGVFGMYGDIQISPLGLQCIEARMSLSPPLNLYDGSFETHFVEWDAIIHAHQGITGLLAQRLNQTIQQVNQSSEAYNSLLGSTQDLVENFTVAFLSTFSLDGKVASTAFNVTNVPNANANHTFNVAVPFSSIRYNSSNIWYYYTNQSKTSMTSTLLSDTVVFDNNGDEITILSIFNYDGQNSNLLAKFNLLYDSYISQPNINATWPNANILNEYAAGWPSDRTPPLKFVGQCLTCSQQAVTFASSSSSSLSSASASASSTSASSTPVFFTNVHNLQSVYELVVSVANPSLSQLQFSCDGSAPLDYSLLPLLPGISSINTANSGSDSNNTTGAIQLTTSSNGNLLQVNSASLIALLDSLYAANPAAFSSADAMPAITPAELSNLSGRLASSNAVATSATDAATIVGVINGANHEFRLSLLLTCDNGANSVNAVLSILTTPAADVYTPSYTAQLVLYSMNSFGLFTVCVFGGLVYAHREHKVIFSSSPLFLFTILCGFAFLFVSSLLSILPASTAICQSKLILFHFGFILALGSIFVKTYRLHRIFNSNNLFNISISNSKLLGGVSLLLAIDVILLLCWIEISGVHIFSVNEPYCYTAGASNVIFPALFAATKGMIILCGVYLTFKVRGLPDSFNESRDISLVIYNTAVLALIYIAVFFATSLEPAQLSLFTSVIVFVGALANLFIFFGPKFRAMKGDIFDFSHSGLTSMLSAIALGKKRNVKQQSPLGLSLVDGRLSSLSGTGSQPVPPKRTLSASEHKSSVTTVNDAVEETKSINLKDVLQELKKDFLSKISAIKTRRLELFRLDKRSADLTTGLAKLMEALTSVVLTARFVICKVNRGQSKRMARTSAVAETDTERAADRLQEQAIAAELEALVELPIEALEVDAANPLHYEIAQSFQRSLPGQRPSITQMKQKNQTSQPRRPSIHAMAMSQQHSVSPVTDTPVSVSHPIEDKCSPRNHL